MSQQPIPENPYDYSSPRPYAWKTDEFQTQTEPRPTEHINRVQPLTQPFNQLNQNYPAPIAYNQPQPLSSNFSCPRCSSHNIPRFEKQISTAGWITFAVLLVVFFPLFWIGLLIKEDVMICQICNLKVKAQLYR
ncbi:MAG: LITAF-like zinc ribbon domain-containing protein [Pyrinomonadaceae bacterium]